MTAHQLRCAWLRLRSATRAPDPDYWPTCPLCRSRDWVRIESWARWPVCSRPNCVYRRALRKTVIVSDESVSLIL
jgi:hypothetical protein